MASERSPLIDGVQCSETVSYDSVQSAAEKKVTPLPKLQLFVLLYIGLGEPITATVIYPFIVQLVRDTGVTGGDESKTGYYAGFIEAIFFAAEAVTVFWWCRASDYIGRKPPLIIGTIILTFATLCFGLTKTLWVMIICRCFQGVSNGNIGITKSALADITDETNMSRAFGLIYFMWGFGITFGPVIGGVLSHPAVRWPSTFGKIPFFHQYPYFLPCAVASLVPISALILSVGWLKESLPSIVSGKLKKKNADADLPYSEQTPQLTTESSADEPPPLGSLVTKPVLIALINHGFLAYVDACMNVLVPLVYATSIPYGGLGLDPYTIGIAMSTAGLTMGFVSGFVFPFLMDKFGIYKVQKFAFSCYVYMMFAFPLMNFCARRAGHADIYVWMLLVPQLLGVTLVTMNYSCIFIYYNDCAPPKALGAVQGLGQSVACSMRVFAPLTASSLFSLTQQKHLLGGTMVYWIMLAFVFGGLGMSFRLPRKLKTD